MTKLWYILVALILFGLVVILHIFKFFFSVQEHKNDVPKKGEKIPFYDDGKTGLSRRYIAIVEKVIPSRLMILLHPYIYYKWRKEKQDCFWCYNKKTDFFIICRIPGYDDKKIVFVRTCDNRWFSFDTISSWMSGLLDYDGKTSVTILEYELACQKLDIKNYDAKFNFEMMEKGYNGKFANEIKREEVTKIFLKYCLKALKKD